MKYISLILGIGNFMGAGSLIGSGDKTLGWFVLLVSILNLMYFAIEETADIIKKHLDKK
jgi:hypothetical protein